MRNSPSLSVGPVQAIAAYNIGKKIPTGERSRDAKRKATISMTVVMTVRGEEKIS